jgi:hypothetical protein
MLGGTIVQDEREAAEYSRMHAQEVGPALLQPGDFVELPPCLPLNRLVRLQKQQGRDCPRVELPLEAAPAIRLIEADLYPHTRELVPALLSDIAPAERGPAARRAARALLAPDVIAHLYPKREG